jgi:hypothetical protein
MLLLWGVLWTTTLHKLGVRLNYRTISTAGSWSVMWRNCTRIQVTFGIISQFQPPNCPHSLSSMTSRFENRS